MTKVVATQHDEALKAHRDQCSLVHTIALHLQNGVERLTPEEVVEVFEAGLSSFLMTARSLENRPAVTLLWNGEIATDALAQDWNPGGGA